MNTSRVSLVGRSLASRRLLRRLATLAGLEAIESQPRMGDPPPRAALFHLPAWSEKGLDEARQLVRDLTPTPVLVLTEDCHGDSCSDVRGLGAAACVALLEDETRSAEALANALESLDTGPGLRCPRCPLGLVGDEGPVCTSFVPDSLHTSWTGHDSSGAPCFPFIAVSLPMKELEETARRVSTSDANLLITGESGVGKEVLARFIHRSGGRARGPFVKVNCAALPDHLLESELFGYEKGAFTGADARKRGRFESADGGIILLDEISEMSLALQAKLLQVLEDKTFNRLGGLDAVTVDVQIVAATNRELEEDVAAGRFREDLYFRLRVIELQVPPLRERREDVPPLVDYFLCRFSRQYGQPAPPVSPSTLSRLQEAPWDGNVRQLENLVRRLVILGNEEAALEQLNRTNGGSRDEAVSAAEAPPPGTASDRTFDLKETGRRAAREAERDAILAALNRTQWNRTRAARLLRVSYKTLLSKMKKLLPPGPESS